MSLCGPGSFPQARSDNVDESKHGIGSAYRQLVLNQLVGNVVRDAAMRGLLVSIAGFHW